MWRSRRQPLPRVPCGGQGGNRSPGCHVAVKAAAAPLPCRGGVGGGVSIFSLISPLFFLARARITRVSEILVAPKLIIRLLDVLILLAPLFVLVAPNPHRRPAFFHERPPFFKMRPPFFHERPPFFKMRPPFFHERPAFFCPRPWDFHERPAQKKFPHWHFLLPAPSLFISFTNYPPSTLHQTPPPVQPKNLSRAYPVHACARSHIFLMLTAMYGRKKS